MGSFGKSRFIKIMKEKMKKDVRELLFVSFIFLRTY